MPVSKDKWVRRFVINETTRHKRGFTIYKVTSMIFLKSSPDTASKVSVWKRYNDFKKLHADLKILHGTLRVKEPYPTFPKPKFFGRFEAEVIEERRECAVKFLEFVARHASLFGNEIFVNFFETSLNDETGNDCSRSVSSDTSEDDKSTSAENAEETTSIEGKADDEVRVLNNNNTERNNDDVNWQQFLSIEKLLENGKTDSPSGKRHKNNSGMTCDNENYSETGQDTGQYILIAAAHMSAGFRHEAMAEYEEAFMQYKLGISNLRQGVQRDPDIVRTATIKDKIAKYSERADRLYNRHLNCNISMISKPVSELGRYKVLRVMGSAMLVNDLQRQITRVIKTIEKPAGIQEDISKYILRGKVPYMVQLHACIQTETTVFLILQYASGGKLWDVLKSQYPIPPSKVSLRRRNQGRSTSCEAVIHVDAERRTNTSLDRASKDGVDREKITANPYSENAHESAKDVDTIDQASSRSLEEEFSGNSIRNEDIPTTKLLEKAQQLLKSVDATIKKSNSIATRLNESGRLLYGNETPNERRESVERDNVEGSGDSSELSMSDSLTDLSTESVHEVSDRSGKTASSPGLVSPESDEMRSEGTSRPNGSPYGTKNPNELSYHDEADSGIEMEQELWQVPETTLKFWAAQILLALEALHQQNVVISDLRPDNLLVDEDSRILLSYVVPRHNPQLSRYQKPYSAPELCMYLPIVPASPAADVWSFGVILYELFTGIPFQSRHPGPFHSHSIVSIPNELSENAKSLLTKVLKFEPSERTTIPEIKQLPFFEKTDWLVLLNG